MDSKLATAISNRIKAMDSVFDRNPAGWADLFPGQACWEPLSQPDSVSYEVCHTVTTGEADSQLVEIAVPFPRLQTTVIAHASRGANQTLPLGSDSLEITGFYQGRGPTLSILRVTSSNTYTVCSGDTLNMFFAFVTSPNRIPEYVRGFLKELRSVSSRGPRIQSSKVRGYVSKAAPHTCGGFDQAGYVQYYRGWFKLSSYRHLGWPGPVWIPHPLDNCVLTSGLVARRKSRFSKIGGNNCVYRNVYINNTGVFIPHDPTSPPDPEEVATYTLVGRGEILGNLGKSVFDRVGQFFGRAID